MNGLQRTRSSYTEAEAFWSDESEGWVNVVTQVHPMDYQFNYDTKRDSSLNTDDKAHDTYDICRLRAKHFATEELVEMIDKLEKATLVAEELDMFRALNDEFESRWNTKRTTTACTLTSRWAGLSTAAIVDAFVKADNNNKPRLVRAFPEIFIP